MITSTHDFRSYINLDNYPYIQVFLMYLMNFKASIYAQLLDQSILNILFYQILDFMALSPDEGCHLYVKIIKQQQYMQQKILNIFKDLLVFYSEKRFCFIKWNLRSPPDSKSITIYKFYLSWNAITALIRN